MHGPGDDERTEGEDEVKASDAEPSAEAEPEDAETPEEDGSPEDAEAPEDGEAPEDAEAPEDGEAPEDAEAPSKPDAPKVAVGWGETRPKWERPLPPEEEEEEAPDIFDTSIRRTSRSHKEQVGAFAKLTKDIFELSDSKRAKLDLDPEVAAAFKACASIKKGAKVRELRRISTMLRRFDGADLRARVDDLQNKDKATSQRSKSYERWRERLLEEGDAALSELVQTYPQADRQRLRQLVRTANRDRTQGKSRQAFRDLLREVRALDENRE
jgi:ribosome-associated protein